MLLFKKLATKNICKQSPEEVPIWNASCFRSCCSSQFFPLAERLRAKIAHPTPCGSHAPLATAIRTTTCMTSGVSLIASSVSWIRPAPCATSTVHSREMILSSGASRTSSLTMTNAGLSSIWTTWTTLRKTLMETAYWIVSRSLSNWIHAIPAHTRPGHVTENWIPTETASRTTTRTPDPAVQTTATGRPTSHLQGRSKDRPPT